MRGGAKYFAWLGQLDAIGNSRFKRKLPPEWPMFACVAYNDAWRVESNRFATEQFNQKYMRQQNDRTH
jgi:hypothetical protein